MKLSIKSNTQIMVRTEKTSSRIRIIHFKIADNTDENHNSEKDKLCLSYDGVWQRKSTQKRSGSTNCTNRHVALCFMS